MRMVLVMLFFVLGCKTAAGDSNDQGICAIVTCFAIILILFLFDFTRQSSLY